MHEMKDCWPFAVAPRGEALNLPGARLSPRTIRCGPIGMLLGWGVGAATGALGRRGPPGHR